MARILVRGKLINTGKNKRSVKRPDKVIREHSTARICKRKGRKLNTWDENRMKEAMKEFKEGSKGLREIARAWNVPKTTLARRVKGDGLAAGYKHASGKQPVLPESVEKELVDHITLLAKRGFPLSRKDIQRVAFEYASEHQLSGFNPSRCSAGHYWFQGLLKRWPKISVKKPESLSAGRAMGMNEQVVSNWFDMYAKTLDELGIADLPAHIWNTDETGLQDHFVSDKVVAEKGRPCYEINASEKGETSTVLATFNAVGQYSPPMVIFKGKRLKAEWCVGASTGTLVRVSDNGWITTELFLEWGKMFVNNLPKDDTRPHLLLLDGHGSHVFNLSFLQLMKENNIHPLCFPPHTTHWLQPADKTFFKSLKHGWTAAGRSFMRENAGKRPDRKQFFELFVPSWTQAASVETAQSGFRETGMFPVNKNAVPQHAFEPSQTSDQPSKSQGKFVL